MMLMFFTGLLAICISSFLKCLCKSLGHRIGILSFYCEVKCSYCILEQILCQVNVWGIYLGNNMFGEQFQLCRPVFLLFLMLTRGERIKFWLGPMNLFLLFAHLKKYIFIYFWLQHVEAWPGILGPQWGSELRHCSRKSTEPQPLDHQGTPCSCCFCVLSEVISYFKAKIFFCVLFWKFYWLAFIFRSIFLSS